MGSPTNLSDRGAGEMSAAAKMHGRPLAQLNTLTRWYLLSGFGLLTLLPLLVLESRFWGLLAGSRSLLLVLAGAQLLLAGGYGIKFTPSSLGGNPHVYSLRMALWSYWMTTLGVLGYVLAGALAGRVPPVVHDPLAIGSLLSFFAGGGLLLYNLWRTMQSRV